MAKQEHGLGKGLNAIFGNTGNIEQKKPKTFKTVAETVAEKKNEDSYNVGLSHIDEYDANKVERVEIITEIQNDQVLKDQTNSNELSIDSIDSDIKTEETGGVLIKLSRIQPDKNQPRMNFDEEKLQELADSIKEYGVITPIIVKQNGAFYEIVAGERRWRAARIAGLKEIPVIIKNVDERTSREMSIIENIQRDDLNPVEEALAYQSLIDDYGLTQEEVASRVSKNRSTITNSLRLLKLDDDVLEMLKEGLITQGHARALLVIEDTELRKKIALRCAKENLSVREIENLVKQDKLSKEKKNNSTSPEAEELKRLKILYKDLEKKMKAKLGTKVSIVPKNKDKGKLEIEYYSQDELDRLYMILNSGRDE
ncbi:ParB/RepB/Spo0J family partition protein [Oribacterium sp. WCC10]|uniref:ParB/RepB/Spo0J family partition protein n=1 Tax=Oribacterium sp. WCC10 TaxID=1855343 RepID=UPI0008E30EF6|nr:ParB/RepB/Spo0J family partition protein [Oribacterium sp. WCC10]SFG72199.1 chromosome partitioning protein, ParB family [Oribacterium sp. WCC10]